MASSPDNPFRLPFNWQRQSIAAMTEAIDGSEDLPEQLSRMLTVEVGQTPSDVVYEENKLELLHYDAEAAGIDVPAEEREEIPILIVYALINRPYILDLQPDRSVVRRLLEAGHDVYLIEWNEPSRLDRHLTLEDYVTRYIQNCVDVVRERSGQDAIDLLGYCMGGTMAAMYAGLYPEKVNALGLMAAGLCFDDTGGVLEQWGSDEYYDPREVVDTFGNVPSEMLDVGFAMMDPIDNYVSKYIRLGENIENEAFLENFARMEKWLSDGVDLAGDTYAEFLEKVYQNNELYENELEIDGRRVDLEAIDMPILQLIGEYDHLVPPGSSRPFNEVVGSDDVTTIEYETGHIGLSVSSSSHEDVWPEAAAWFKAKNRPEAPEPEIDEEVPPPEEEAPASDVSFGDNEAEVAEEAAEEGDVGEAAEQAVEEAVEEVEPEDEEAAEAEAAEEAAGGEPAAEAPDVETVDGIGPTYRDRLHEAGIQTTADLAELSAAEIAEIAQTSESRAQDWLDEL